MSVETTIASAFEYMGCINIRPALDNRIFSSMSNIFEILIQKQHHKTSHAAVAWIVLFIISLMTGGSIYTSLFTSTIFFFFYLFSVLITSYISNVAIHLIMFVTSFSLIPPTVVFLAFSSTNLNQRISDVEVFFDGAVTFQGALLFIIPLIWVGTILYYIPAFIHLVTRKG